MPPSISFTLKGGGRRKGLPPKYAPARLSADNRTAGVLLSQLKGASSERLGGMSSPQWILIYVESSSSVKRANFVTDWSCDRKSRVGEHTVRLWRVPASSHSCRAADATRDSSRLLSALAANHHRQVLPLR